MTLLSVVVLSSTLTVSSLNNLITILKGPATFPLSFMHKLLSFSIWHSFQQSRLLPWSHVMLYFSYSFIFSIIYSPNVNIPLPYQSCSALVSPSVSLWRFNNYDLNQSKCLQQCSQGCFAKDSQITSFCNYHKEQLTLPCKCTTLVSEAVYFLYCISSFRYSIFFSLLFSLLLFTAIHHDPNKDLCCAIYSSFGITFTFLIDLKADLSFGTYSTWIVDKPGL